MNSKLDKITSIVTVFGYIITIGLVFFGLYAKQDTYAILGAIMATALLIVTTIYSVYESLSEQLELWSKSIEAHMDIKTYDLEDKLELPAIIRKRIKEIEAKELQK